MEEWSDTCEVEKSGNRDAVIVTGDGKDWGRCKNLPLPRRVGRGVRIRRLRLLNMIALAQFISMTEFP